MITGHVKADGTSTLALAAGVYDMAALADSARITPEVEAALAAACKQELPSRAKFKLEVFFRYGPRHNVPVRGALFAWTNGGFFNGGGDQSVYFCPRPKEDGTSCLNPIDVQFRAKDYVVCPACRRITHTKELLGQLIADVPIEKWAPLLVRFFYKLECGADIRICVSRESLITAAGAELERSRGGERYAAVQRKMEWVAYPLQSIIKDTASGSSLETRFLAFLKA